MAGKRMVKAVALVVSGGLLMGLCAAAHAAGTYSSQPVNEVKATDKQTTPKHAVKRTGEVAKEDVKSADKTVEKDTKSVGKTAGKEATKVGKATKKTGNAVGKEFKKGERLLHKSKKHVTK